MTQILRRTKDTGCFVRSIYVRAINQSLIESIFCKINDVLRWRKNSSGRWHRKQEGSLHIFDHAKGKENGTETRSLVTIVPTQFARRRSKVSEREVSHGKFDYTVGPRTTRTRTTRSHITRCKNCGNIIY